MYKKGVNPCAYIIASDVLTLLAGSWDDGNPNYEIQSNNWIASDYKSGTKCGTKV